MKALIIYNKSAMKGKIEKKIPYIQKRIMVKYSVCDFISPESGKMSEQVAFERARDYDIVVVAGGDGTIHYVANGIAKSGAPTQMAVLPVGTVNDVARNLNIPKKLDNAIDVILRGSSIPYDLIFDGKDYVVYTLSAGMFVSSSYCTSNKSKKFFGRLAYFLRGFCMLFKMTTMPLTISSDDYVSKKRLVLLLVLNSYSTGGFFINGESSVSDGKMEAIMLEKRGNAIRNYFVNIWTIFCLFVFGLKSIKKFKHVKILYTDNIKIENHSNLNFSADGEKQEFLSKQMYTGEKSTRVNIMHGMSL